MTMPRQPGAHSRVYKIVTEAQWGVLNNGEPWLGAPVDLADGFVHFSAFDQVQGTLDKHFAGQQGLRVLEIPVDRLDPSALRWEVSRNGDLFPHLYGPLLRDRVTVAHPVRWSPHDGFAPLELPV